MQKYSTILKMRWVILCLTSLAILNASPSNNKSFSPVEPALFRGFFDDYFDFLKQTVFKSFRTDRYVTFCAIPSFRPEWGLWIFPDNDRNYTLYVSEAPENLFHAGRFVREVGEVPLTREKRKTDLAPTIKLREAETVLERGFGDRIIAAWYQILFDARFSTEIPGYDGTTYYYFATDHSGGRFIAAKKWTPQVDSPAGMLASLAHELRDYATGETTTRAKLIKQLRLIEAQNIQPSK